MCISRIRTHAAAVELAPHTVFFHKNREVRPDSKTALKDYSVSDSRLLQSQSALSFFLILFFKLFFPKADTWPSTSTYQLSKCPRVQSLVPDVGSIKESVALIAVTLSSVETSINLHLILAVLLLLAVLLILGVLLAAGAYFFVLHKPNAPQAQNGQDGGGRGGGGRGGARYCCR